MTAQIVNVETGEIAEALSEDEARRLTERIRIAAANYTDAKAKVLALVDEAKAGHAHIALGYRSWTAYLSDVLSDEPLRLARDERRELVERLSDEGMSRRAIAPIVGVSDGTVQRDLEVVRDVPVATVRTTTGLNGGTYTTATAGRLKSDPKAEARAMGEANAINAFTSMLRRAITPANVATLTPAAKRRLVDLLNEAIATLTEGDSNDHD